MYTKPQPWRKRARLWPATSMALLVLLAAILTKQFKRLFPISKEYEAMRNPPWSAARWRAGEHSDKDTFSQWYYAMVTDAESKITYSLTLGGFRAKGATGWLKARHVDSEDDTIAKFEVPFSAIQHSNDVDVTISDSVTGDFASLMALDGDRLQLRFKIGASSADVIFTRTYGAFGSGKSALPASQGGKAEECLVANLPFAYASLVDGSIRLATPQQSSSALRPSEHDPDLGVWVHSVSPAPGDGPRYRGYVESTWGCTFPQGGGDDPSTAHLYPWRWMWWVAPAQPASSNDDSSISSRVVDSELPPSEHSLVSGGEVGLVVSNARMAIPILPSLLNVTQRVDLDVQGTFAFLDFPHRRIAAANVTIFDGSPSWAVPLLLAAPDDIQPLLGLWMELGDWQPYSDAHGSASLPMRQVLRLLTSEWDVTVTYLSKPSQFVRLAVRYNDEHDGGREKVVSDFRASFSQASIRVMRTADATAAATDGSGGKPRLYFEGATLHNAVEFAFHAPYKEAAAGGEAS